MVLFPNLLALMASIGMKKKDVAKLLDKSATAITKRFNGEYQWKWGEVVKITQFFKSKVDTSLTSDYIFFSPVVTK